MIDLKTRWARIVATRDAGTPFTEIGEAFGITPGRARILYRRGVKEAEPRIPMHDVSVTTPIADLPIGKDARAALLRYGVPLADLAHRERQTLQPELLQLPNCNRRALIEIEAVLDACLANLAS